MRAAAAKSKAFTLLELLVTMAVIAILTTLVATAINKARLRARNAQCLNNLTQYGFALHAFVQENAKYPLLLNPGFKLGVEPDHYANLWAALTNYGLPPLGASPLTRAGRSSLAASVHVCAAADAQIRPMGEGSREITGYGYNAYGLGSRTEPEPLGLAGTTAMGRVLIGPVAESAIVSPSNMITIGDAVRGWDQTYEDGLGIISRSSEAAEYASSNQRVRSRHQNRLMILFADSHVAAVPLKRLFADATDDALSMWNRDALPHRERLK